MKIITTNKKAYFNYDIIETIMAGIVLLGSEVKSIRAKEISIKEAFCHVDNGEMWLKGAHIAQFTQSGMYQNHDPYRDRKLLLNKNEIIKLEEKASKKGQTIVPLKVFITKTGLIKIDIGLGKGKKIRDKRESIKAKDLDREQKRENKFN